MKQLILFTGVILFSCVIVSSVIVPARAEQSNIEKVTQALEEQQDKIYVLKSSDGNLSVFIKGSTKPVITTETRVSVLPKEDQQKLEKGIEVKGERELHRALEDYCS